MKTVLISLILIFFSACTPNRSSNISLELTPTDRPLNQINPTTNEKILIRKQRDYFLAKADGSEQFLLYPGEASPLEMASLSPDATKFAYFKDNYVYMQEIKTRKAVILNKEIVGSMGGQIRWSPDAKKLAMTCSIGGQPSPAICLIDTQSGSIEILINEKNTYEFCSKNLIELQDWSKDGLTMIYSCFIVPEKGQKEVFSIYSYDVNSKTSKKILDGTTQDLLWYLGSASLSPDKNYLLINGGDQQPKYQVYLLDQANNTLKQLTYEQHASMISPTWSIDGRSIYLHRVEDQIPYPESNFVMDMNGNILSQIKIDGAIIEIR
ncbi:MAG TPA: hypothetical protein VK206_20165 [Anaerolineales bacterium]|nr:hypothetical protein [Anaerolineales bacterium]